MGNSYWLESKENLQTGSCFCECFGGLFWSSLPGLYPRRAHPLYSRSPWQLLAQPLGICRPPPASRTRSGGGGSFSLLQVALLDRTQNCQPLQHCQWSMKEAAGLPPLSLPSQGRQRLLSSILLLHQAEGSQQ